MKAQKRKAWAESRIGDVAELFSGSTPSSTDPTLWGGDILWLAPSDITALQESTVVINDTPTKITQRGYDSCSTKLLPPGTVCVSSRATVGDCIILGQAACTNQGFINVVCSEELDPCFFLYWVRQNKRVFLRLAAGTTFDEIGRRSFRNIRFSRPEDVFEQCAIGATLRLLDQQITASRGAVCETERLQRILMRELLSGRITAAGTVRPEIEFVDDGRGALPRTWSRARIKDFGEVSTGKTPPTEVAAHFLGEIPFITPGDMGNTKWLSKSERRLSDSGAKLVGKLPAKTVCVVCIGATIGKVGLTDRPSATNQQISSVICSDQHSPEYLYYAIRFFSRHIAAIAGVNATPQLNKSEFSKVKIPMPADLEEEEAIAGRLSELDNLIEAKRAKITALQRLKKSLMQNLLTGRMRLSPEAIAELTAKKDL